MKNRWIAALVVVVFGTSLAMAAKKKEMTTWNLEDVKWEMEPGAPMSMAPLWGNPKQGPHFGLVKFTKNTNIALHTHSADHYGVVVQGTFTVTDENGNEKTLSPGSALSMPALVKHTTKCGAEADCILAGYITGKDTTKMVKITTPGSATN